MSARKASRAAKVPRFKVGDLAEVVYARAPLISPGMEVEVIGGLATRVVQHPGGRRKEYGYEIQIGCLEGVCVLPDQLRPIRPGEDPVHVIRWSECPWQPGKRARVNRRRKEARI
ncbi:MAG TPA: hypothetical protein VFA39_16500 [Steroidobacteraceae bacterium]|nr:hypothetical protein [Steroidobacteraceae bacterium]